MTTLCITFNIAILCVVQSLYSSNDIYYYSRLTENEVCFNAKQNVALLQTSTRTLQWGPLTLSRKNLHPLATSNKLPNPAFTWLPSLHTIVIIIGRPGFFLCSYRKHDVISSYHSTHQILQVCNHDRCNQFKATCQQSKMKIWDAFSYDYKLIGFVCIHDVVHNVLQMYVFPYIIFKRNN